MHRHTRFGQHRLGVFWIVNNQINNAECIRCPLSSLREYLFFLSQNTGNLSKFPGTYFPQKWKADMRSYSSPLFLLNDR